MGYIYKITNNVNGKIYIGKTEDVNPEKRWKEHLRDYKKERCAKRPLYDAMNKYGIEHFNFEVIEETDNAEERERYWIEKLRTYVGFKDCNGYNATLGGDGKIYYNLNEDEVIRYHIEEANYISRETARHFNCDRSVIIRILKKNKVTYLNFKDVKRLTTYQEYGGVIQVDPNSKIILNIFENVKLANNFMRKKEKDTSIKHACSCYRRNTHYAYGYLWYYGKDLREAIDNGEIIDIGI